MMWDTYEEYCAFMDSKGWDKVIEEVFNREYKRVKTDKHHELMILSPRNQVRSAVSAEQPIRTGKRKVSKSPKLDKAVLPKKPVHCPETKSLTRRPNAIAKTSLKGMSKEERQKHRNKLARERRERDKKNGVLKPLSEERVIKQRSYAKSHYEKNKSDRLKALQIQRKNRTPEEKEVQREYMRTYRKKNRERVNANARAWKKKKRNPIPLNNTSISPDQSLSA
ncbi:hypothetical protein [Sulfuricurvum sp.]|uniref:hypothetical protein n=1 Tax=Sulfuricurvum sp. TaxID=2025608 RepID=UPI002D5792CB|nr:hypothetical protein [Sulfuricurvum sp.]HZF69376.1 hypothetical protein [Sulfuricurvum sp.]